jgi:hypothetical protein
MLTSGANIDPVLGIFNVCLALHWGFIRYWNCGDQFYITIIGAYIIITETIAIGDILVRTIPSHHLII